MKASVVGFVAGFFLVASAAAHALLGWPQVREALKGFQVEPQLVGALAAAWYFGSISMLGFGLILLSQARCKLAGKPVQLGPTWTIAALYAAFGTVAFILRDYNPHFLLFVCTGAVVAIFGYLAGRND